MEIVECPLSSAPPECCDQVEAFWNGMVQSFDPELRFAYERMMTKGDESCHWTIKRKGTIELQKPNEKMEDEEALRILRRRFALGEINEEEYRRSRDVLLER